MTNIGARAFFCCAFLKNVEVLSLTPSALGEMAFDYCGSPGETTGDDQVEPGEGLKIYVPAYRGDAYRSAEGWSVYADKIVELSFVTVSLDVALICESAEAATNVAKNAVFVPSKEIVNVLGDGTTSISNYCAKFGFAVFKVTDGEWAVVAALKPEARAEVLESAQAATRQIPLSDIAALPTEGKKDVTVTGCVPGFYYTLYGAAGVRALPMGDALPTMEATAYGPVLCGAAHWQDGADQAFVRQIA